MVTLVLCSLADDASVNPRNALKSTLRGPSQKFLAMAKSLDQSILTFICLVSAKSVEADSIDKAHEKELNCTVDEVLVSRHVSTTNTPAQRYMRSDFRALSLWESEAKLEELMAS